MKISLIPASGETTASSRIRVYALARSLKKMGIEARIGCSDESDVIFIQKRLDENLLSEAIRFKKAGKLVVYDFDDFGRALEFWTSTHLFVKMLEVADVVTTNTEYFGDLAKKAFHLSRLQILPDIVDYALEHPLQVQMLEDSPTRVLWFGNRSNISLIEKHIPYVVAAGDVHLTICVDRVLCEARRAASFCSFVPWDLVGFPSLLRSCHLSFLAHDGDDADRAKSNNRLITSICWGVPAVVSRTPEYERTAEQAGVGECVFENQADIPKIIGYLKTPDVRKAYLARAQPGIWEKHCGDTVAKRFCEIVESAVANRRWRKP